MHEQKHPWYKRRGYLHFDLPISLKSAESIVTDPSFVKKNSFYPFISYEILSKKIAIDAKDAKIIKKIKSRSVSYASHIDSHIYSYYAFMLGEKYEEYIRSIGIEACVLAFRKLKKSNIHFANEAFNKIKEKQSCTAVALDVTGFFDNLDHKLLKEAWSVVLGVSQLPDDYYNIYKSITKYSKVSKNSLYGTLGISKNNTSTHKRICEPVIFRNVIRSDGLVEKNVSPFGIPQGSPISALLSNIYMIHFDSVMNELVSKNDGVYLRYCDDILLIVPHEHTTEIVDMALGEIKKLKLEINETKTKQAKYDIVDGQLTCDAPLQYLGFIFDGQRKIIRSSALARYSDRMKSGVKLAQLTRNKANNARIKNGILPVEIYKKKLYERYSHLGRRNFISYGFKCADIMDSKSIKRQLKPLWIRLKREIEKY